MAVLLGVAGCSFFTKGETPTAKTSCLDGYEPGAELPFPLQGDDKTRVMATFSAAVQLRQLADKLDEDMAQTCVNLARELGATDLLVNENLAPGARATAACAEASKRVKTQREESRSVLLIYPSKPVCTMPLTSYEHCARNCDPSVRPDTVKVACEPEASAGECKGKCTGMCHEAVTDSCASECRGTCKGKCDDGFIGKCGGRCNGTCDSASADGKCEGTCDGKCSANAQGTCSTGTCTGRCEGACVSEVKDKPCAGVCVGSCSEAFARERCVAPSPPPEPHPACGVMCDAKLTSELDCISGVVDVVVYSSNTPAVAETLKSSLTKRLPALLLFDPGMTPPIERALEGVKGELGNLQGGGASEDATEETPADEPAETGGDSPPPQAAAAPVGGLEACTQQVVEHHEQTAQIFQKLREAAQAVFAAAKG